MNIVKVTFVSIWSGVEYESSAELNTNSGLVFNIESCDRLPDDEGNTNYQESFVRYEKEDMEMTVLESDDGRYMVHAEDLGDLQALISG